MNAHVLLAFLPATLLGSALVVDALRFGDRAGRLAAWARGLVWAGLGLALLAAFTGLGARRRLASALPGDATTPWDGHVLWAVALLVPLLGAGVVRLRISDGDGSRRRWRVLALDVALTAVAVAITVTGARAP